ncbi:hypothetical protein [Mycobacterium sp. URHB0044]|jgi:hypothetical protein|uniref:hypothetical protein n=1 Tax=Mycobacterium sp. URHB0044 TaxID=1380386 RepID=UPI00048DDFAA|nr:hypothetical protein [Mycobacterium sp. URHB0044]
MHQTAQLIHDLTVFAAQADAGRSADDLAAALVRLAVTGSSPDEALRTLATLRPGTWVRLDARLRQWPWLAAADDQRLQITDPARAASDPLALLLTACVYDGHLRQRAVNTPLMRRDQRLLPVLLIRTTDWAPPVRDDARAALDEALGAADTAGLVRAAGVAMALRAWRRGDYAATAVTEAMRTRSDETLDAARASADRQVRRLGYRLWLESSRTDSEALVRTALTERDIVCQRLCAEAVVRAAVRDRRRDTLDRLLAARFARVRAEALDGLVQLGRPEAAEALLSDRSAVVRSTAQWAMRRAGRDAAEHYRAMLVAGDGVTLRGAVAGLGECGTADDARLVADYLRHDRPRVRAEAVRAVRRLGGPLGQIADMLTDPAPIVVRAATATLRGQPDLVRIDRLWELLGTDQPAHARRAAFRLLIARDTWTRIEADLVLVADDQLGARARSDLSSWLQRGAATAYEILPTSTRDRIGRLLDAAEPDIGAEKARLLRWHLGLWR